MGLFRKKKVPLILQMEMTECGAASLTMVLGYYGRYLPLDVVRDACGVSRDGANAVNILKVARKYGLKCGGYRYPVSKLKEIPLPVIVFWQFNHFLVVSGFNEKYVFLVDPALGYRRVTWKEFSDSFTGIVLQLKPGPDFIREDTRPSLIHGLLSFLPGCRPALGLVWAASFLLVLVGFGVPIFTQVFIDFVIIDEQVDWRWVLLWGMVGLILLRLITGYIRQHLLINLRIKLGFALLDRFVEHLLKLPLAFYSERGTGDLMARIQLNNNVRSILSDQLISSLLDIFLVVIYLILMLFYDLTLTMIVLGAAVINVSTIIFVNRARINQNSLMIAAHAKQRSVEMMGLSQIETIKSSGAEDRFYARWRGLAINTINSSRSLNYLSIPLTAIPAVTTAAVSGLVLWRGGSLVIGGAMSIGMVMAFQALQNSFLSPVTRLVGFGGTIQTLKGNWARIEDVLRVKPEPEPEDPVKIGALLGKIELRNITFGYNPTAPPLIKDLSLTIKAGQRVAIVGPSGSGKSTLVKLITGVIPADEGGIFYDDVEMRRLDKIALRRQMGIVNQNDILFKGTVAANLSLWDPDVTMDTMVKAAQDACIHREIISLPAGYDSMLEEAGANLSGGQIQRVCLARALSHYVTILVLDEATSALDTVTEKLVLDNLKKLKCTTIFVAHRLSTVRDMDEILVVHNGAIVERGSHEELIKKNGFYASLIRSE